MTVVTVKKPRRTINSRNGKSGGGSGGLPPILGMIGSIAFFTALFVMAIPTQDGYNMFRKCHGNCVNGILHLIGMPLAVSGAFMIVRSVSDSAIFTRMLQFAVTTGMLLRYLRYETNPWSPWLFYVLYLSIMDGILYQKIYQNPAWTRLSLFFVGAALIVVNVGALEAIGHGIFEHHHSYVLEAFNSMFHTPLYGMNSLLGLFQPMPDHECW